MNFKGVIILQRSRFIMHYCNTLISMLLPVLTIFSNPIASDSTLYPFLGNLGIFVQNCNIWFVVISIFFLHFSIAFRICITNSISISKNISHFAVLLAKIKFLLLAQVGKKVKTFKGAHICAPKLNLLWIRWAPPTCQLLKIKCSLVHSKCRAKNVQKIWLL